MAGGFLGGARGVQGDEAGEDFGVARVRRKAVGGSDGGIQFVVELAEDGDEAGVVRGALLRGERYGVRRQRRRFGMRRRRGWRGRALPAASLRSCHSGVAATLCHRTPKGGGAQLFEHVIHRGEGKAGVLRLHPLAVRVQFLPQGPDARLRRFLARGEGKGVEAEWR